MLKRVLASVLIFMFVGLSINKVSNWHTHVSTDGIVFQHAHPNDNNNPEQHSHNKSDLSCLVLINDLFDDDTVHAFIPAVVSVKVSKDFVWNYIYAFVNEKLFSNKSPPSL